jgi:uncharacterized protein YndB with AHSA1/START domain
MSSTDRIEKEILLRAPRARVWRALTRASEFGEWFRVALEGEFEPGKTMHGKLLVQGFERLRFELVVDEMAPEHRFSFRWHPYAIDPDVDYTSEPKTLVTFDLADADADADGGATKLTVVESGFDAIPPARRALAFHKNSLGWAAQLDNIDAYVRKHL